MKKCTNFRHLAIVLMSLLSLQVFSVFDEDEINSLLEARNGDISESVNKLSAVFLGRSYNTLGPLGEGVDATYDQDPLWRTDEFDCTTYVETVMALLLADDIEDFKRRITEIRYQNGKISFITRNHFTSADWIPQNIELGVIEDITTEVFNEKYIEMASSKINKKEWYKKMNMDRISILEKSTLEDREDLLNELQEEGNQYDPVMASIPFMPIKHIFKKNKKLRRRVFNSINSGDIINIVRPNWNLEKYIGTNINVSHQGLAIRDNGSLYFRHASPSGKGVVKQDLLEDYLRKYIGHKTVKGINILKIIE